MVKNSFVNKLNAFLLISLAFIFLPFYSQADDMPVQSKLQAALFVKILSYDRSIKGEVKIGVYFNASSKSLASKNDIISSFNSLAGEKIAGNNFSVIEVSDLGSIKSKGIDILYITPENRSNLDNISKSTRASGVLSITGVPDYVEDGPISVAIGVKDNKKPDIIVNLSASKAENRDLSSQMLKLAKVIK